MSSFPRKRESKLLWCKKLKWIPASAGMTAVPQSLMTSACHELRKDQLGKRTKQVRILALHIDNQFTEQGVGPGKPTTGEV